MSGPRALILSFVILGVAMLAAFLLGLRWQFTALAAFLVGAALLELCLALATEHGLRRTRPDGLYGRDAPWRHPSRTLGLLLDPIANSRFVRALGELLPASSFVSDITDVLYVNYIVEAERLLPLVPVGLALQRLGPDGRHAFFTFLSYRHGHLGPPWLGPLRRRAARRFAWDRAARSLRR
jgi:hypothetical protein